MAIPRGALNRFGRNKEAPPEGVFHTDRASINSFFSFELLDLFHQLDIQGYFHLIANHHPAAVESFVPAYAEILALKSGSAGQSYMALPLGAFYRRAGRLDIENNILCHAMHGELPIHFKPA